VVPQRTAGRIRGSKAAQNRLRGGNALTRFFGRLRRLASLFAGGASDTRAALGAKGEDLAVRRLRRAGYRIVTRNFRAAGAEIDVIAMDGDTLVFIEVKTRLRLGAGAPEESVNGLKQHRIRKAAEVFVRRPAMARYPIRFDVVAVSRPGIRWRSEIIKDAF
jgi:putative endonuclease